MLWPMRLPEKTTTFCLVLACELRRRREVAGLSMNELATSAGLSQPMIGFIEKGTCVPTAASLFRIASVLGCPLSEIFGVVEKEIASNKKIAPTGMHAKRR